MKQKLTEWRMEDYVTSPDKAADILDSAVSMCKKRTKEDLEFLLIICNDIARIAEQKGWLDEYKARVSRPQS